MRPATTTLLNKAGEYVLPGYEWIGFSSIREALKWRKRNHRLRTVYDLDRVAPK